MFKRFISWLFWWSTEEAFDNGMMAGAEMGIRYERERIKQLILENTIEYPSPIKDVMVTEIRITSDELIELLDKDQIF
jgi:hypothetical protein